jgi:arylsulfatase A-like enzyme
MLHSVLLLLLVIIGGTGLCTSVQAQATGATERPNIVLVMTDDAGYGDLGSYGAPDVRTPHIDRLARDGVRLTDFYANGATCTPTRTALISGRYQQRLELEAPLGVLGEKDWGRGLAPTGRSLPRLLKNNDYATALIGKWHLGWKDEFSPTAHGFDYFFGFKSGYTDYYQHTAGGDSPLKADLFENDRSVEVPGYMTDLITERSVQFIQQNANRPFFIDVAYNAPHWPYQRPDQPSTARDNARHLGPFDEPTNTRADYVAMMERVDRGVGRIVEVLDKLGLRQNTIFIFTNDNGGEWLSRGAPLSHHKGTVWEGGIRVPAIFRWPGRIPAGQVSDQVGITMDLTATILAATGTPVPSQAGLEGMNLMPVLERRAPVVERTLFWRVTGIRPQQAVRMGDWKLLLDGGRAMLFDLHSDIGERANLIAQRSDVARRLHGLLAAWEDSVNAEAKRATGAGEAR